MLGLSMAFHSLSIASKTGKYNQPTPTGEERKKYIAKKSILGFNLPLTCIPFEFHPKKLKRISLTSLFNCNHIHSILLFPDENFPAKDKNLVTKSEYVKLIKLEPKTITELKYTTYKDL